MFFGETTINLDVKGRMAVPTRYREQIDALCQGAMVATYNPYETNCLFLFPQEHWQEIREKVMSLGSSNPRFRWMQRQLVGSAAPLTPDSHWRIQMPQQLREVANMDKRVVLMGMGDKFEIWNAEVLEFSRQQYMEEQKRMMEAGREEAAKEAEEQIKALGI